MSSNKKIALFGATGNTGREFLPAALSAGYQVRALLRSPSKVADQDGVEKVQGDLLSAEDVAAVIEGCDIVVFLVNVPRKTKKGSKLDGFTSKALKAVVAGMEKHNVRRLLYQGGGFTLFKGDPPTPCFVGCCIRDCILSRCLGESIALQENQVVADFLQTKNSSIDWTFTRPGMLEHKPARGPAVSAKNANTTVTFKDLAAWEVQLIGDDNTIHTSPMVGYPPKGASNPLHSSTGASKD
eukprot:g3896.t1